MTRSMLFTLFIYSFLIAEPATAQSSDVLVFEYKEYESFSYTSFEDVRLWNKNASPKWQLIENVIKNDEKKELIFVAKKAGKYAIYVTYFDSDLGDITSNRREIEIAPEDASKTVIIRFKDDLDE